MIEMLPLTSWTANLIWSSRRPCIGGTRR